MLKQSILSKCESPENAPQSVGYQLAVIVPTFNEAANVERMLAAIDYALEGIKAEILFVDDWSPDGTAARLAHIARGRVDVRVLRRWNRHGLSSAVIEGMMATMAPVVAVLDGDGQHDESLLPQLFKAVTGGHADVAIGSRYCASGSTGSWCGHRASASRIATRLSRLALAQDVEDPMSGFFAIRRDAVELLLPKLSGRGFKILFDLLSSGGTPLRIVELPYEFRSREHGESKLATGVMVDYLVMLADRAMRRFLPPRAAMFAGVGALGLGVHLATLKLLLSVDGLRFESAQAGAVVVAIAFNFLMNNSLTFRDRKLKGMRLLIGLSSFYCVCGLGALANIGVGTLAFAAHDRWWLSGAAGAVVGAAWNFGASMLVTWRKR